MVDKADVSCGGSVHIADTHCNLSASSSSYWMDAIVVVSFHMNHGQVIDTCYPTSFLSDLDSSSVDKIKMLSMPDCLEPKPLQEFIYMYRIKDNRNVSNSHNSNCYLNCYVCFRQQADPSNKRAFLQQSIVLISKHSYGPLFTHILVRLSSVFRDVPLFSDVLKTPSKGTADDEGSVHSNVRINPSVLSSLLEVSFQHFDKWATPHALLTNATKKTLLLPFYGDMLQYPCSINLIQLFSRLGLLECLWSLYELMITGRCIVVFSPSACICSKVVQGLVSMIEPLVCNEYSPYINASVCSNSELEQTSKARIVGLSNPFLLRYFDPKVYSILILPNVDSSVDGTAYSSCNRDLLTDASKYIDSFVSKLSFMSSPATPTTNITTPAASPSSSSNGNGSDVFSPIGYKTSFVDSSTATNYCRKVCNITTKVVTISFKSSNDSKAASHSLDSVCDTWLSDMNANKDGLLILKFKPTIKADTDILLTIASLTDRRDSTSHSYDDRTFLCNRCSVGNTIMMKHFNDITQHLFNIFTAIEGRIDVEASFLNYNRVEAQLPMSIRRLPIKFIDLLSASDVITYNYNR